MLDAVTSINPDLPFIILPADTKNNDSVGLGEPLQDLISAVDFLVADKRHDALRNLMDGLVELGFAWIAPFESAHEFVK